MGIQSLEDAGAAVQRLAHILRRSMNDQTIEAVIECLERTLKVKSSHVVPALNRRDVVRTALGVSAPGAAR